MNKLMEMRDGEVDSHFDLPDSSISMGGLHKAPLRSSGSLIDKRDDVLGIESTLLIFFPDPHYVHPLSSAQQISKETNLQDDIRMHGSSPPREVGMIIDQKRLS
jgi:hypothetical protein